MIGIKAGVKLIGLVPQISIALITMEILYRMRGTDLIITAGVDGKHKRQSAHYTGRAVDLRTNNLLPGANKEELVKEAQDLLGVDFDVILESDHIHLEWDPKEAINAPV